MTAACSITGDAVVTRTIVPGQPDRDRLWWERADPETHISEQLLGVLDERGRAFLHNRYELGEACPHQPGNRHARRRP